MANDDADVGRQMWDMAEDLFPICRSLSGPGVRQTLLYLKKHVPELEISEVESGTAVFDWTVPDEWSVKTAFIETLEGRRVVDFADNNLHLMGYSVAVDKIVTRAELEKHLYSLPDQPDAIPYVTSYYNRKWGFCVNQHQYNNLKDEKYRVRIDSDLSPGVLNYAEVYLPGETRQEIMLSTYVCHPSMANNELSGPVVAVALIKWLKSLKSRRYSYRIIFVPETIGSIVYLARHLQKLQENVVAGYILTCMGDDADHSFMPSRTGDTLADRAALAALGATGKPFTKYSFLDRGSDERQFCSVRVDLPFCSIMRSKYGTFKQYHTSLDNMDFITPESLAGSFAVMKATLGILESNRIAKAVLPCEPFFSKYGLRDQLIGNQSLSLQNKLMSDIVAYADGRNDLITLSEIVKRTPDEVAQAMELMENIGIIARCED